LALELQEAVASLVLRLKVALGITAMIWLIWYFSSIVNKGIDYIMDINNRK